MKVPSRVGDFIDLQHSPCPSGTGCQACRDTGMQVAAVHSFLARVLASNPARPELAYVGMLRSECLELAMAYLDGALPPRADYGGVPELAAMRRRVGEAWLRAAYEAEDRR